MNYIFISIYQLITRFTQDATRSVWDFPMAICGSQEDVPCAIPKAIFPRQKLETR